MMLTICFLLLTFHVLFNSASLPSEFYQPTSGAYFEIWTSNTLYSMSNFNSIPNYPDCPTFVTHSDTFAYSKTYSGDKQYGRFRASFVSNQTGIHKFFALLNNEAQIYIDLNPAKQKKILDVKSTATDNWNYRKWCDQVNLMKGFRYKITVYYYGNGLSPELFKLGVIFPDNSEVKPVDSSYLRRSMEYYKWNGLLAHKYDNFKFPTAQSDYTLAKAYSKNPTYPSNPASYMCKSTLYEPKQKQFDYYALRYIGYMSVPETGNYTMKMFCDELCQINMTKSGYETVLGDYNDADESSVPFVEMNAGILSSQILYPIKVFFCESYGYDYIQISYQNSSSIYSTSWSGRLHNLLQADTASSIPPPVPAMINSTAISVTLPSTPYLPPKDGWTYAQASEVLYHRSGIVEAPQKLTVSGALPQTINATGLKKYTDYLFYAHYFGNMNRKDQNIITRYSAVVKTDEDVPESAPPSFVVEAQSSTSIKCRWGSISNLSLWNGVGLGYEVQYRLKGAHTRNWTSVKMNGTSNRQHLATGLLIYRLYEFKVAGRTIKGSGVFSEVKEGRTMEYVPSAAPSNIIAMNSSSSSIVVTWSDVPTEHQNGIITGYRVYIKKHGSGGGKSQEDTDSKRWSKAGLDFWTLYDIKISAKTSVGEGVKSVAVSVRTGEDAPDGPPTSVRGGYTNQTAIYVTWDLIPILSRNGIIVKYNIAYKQTNSSESWKVVSVDSQILRVEIGQLQYNKFYDFKVAGRTLIGQGPYSAVISIRTDAYGEFYTDIKYTNTSLKNHLVKHKQVDSLSECFRYCLQCDMGDGCTCSSINFSYFQIDSKNECEVNSEAHYEYGIDFVPRPGFQYYERH